MDGLAGEEIPQNQKLTTDVMKDMSSMVWNGEYASMMALGMIVLPLANLSRVSNYLALVWYYMHRLSITGYE